MDGFDEKKWFLYMGDHHEGPFSLAEIQQKMTQGQATAASYVWCEGMPDWKPMSDLPAFEPLLSGSGSRADGDTLVASVVDSQGPVLESSVTLSETPIVASIGAELEAPGQAPVAPFEAREPAPPTTAAPVSVIPAPSVVEAPSASAPKMKKERQSSRWLKWLLPLLFITLLGGAYVQGYLDTIIGAPVIKASMQAAGDIVRPQLAKVVDKVPALGKWISPLPSLADVSTDDYEDLKTAAMARMEQGPRVALALVQSDLLAPTFYVSTNLPDGTAFDVYVEGVADTLLNHMAFNGKVDATVQRRLGKTMAIRFSDGKPLPRGEYNVYVIEAENQPEPVRAILASAQPSGIKVPSYLPKGSRVIFRKTYFLGGQRDAMYTARLKEYHEKLRARAAAELNELKQFAATVESQLNSSIANFAQLRKGKVSRPQQTKWGSFHSKWTQLDAQLSQSFQKWTPEALQSEYFYGSVYQLLQQAGQAVARVHGVHHAYFTGSVDRTSFEIQVGEAVSQAQTAMMAVKTKIEQAEKIPASANGMPQREGL